MTGVGSVGNRYRDPRVKYLQVFPQVYLRVPGPDPDSCPSLVVAIFTKFDALVTEAFQTLRKKKMSLKDAKAQALTHAKEAFAKEYLHLVYEKQYPPKGHLYLLGE